MPNDKPFKNVNDQIGYCGIWCGSCVAGNGTLQVLTRKYEGLISAYGLEHWAPKTFDFREFQRGLVAIKEMPSCPGCLQGGGNEGCEIRVCAQEMNIDDCSLCQESSSCKHADALQKMRSGALDAELFVKNEDIDRQELMEKWIIDLKAKWPGSMLFMDED